MIDRFTGQHGFLSNFSVSFIEYEGFGHPTVEHAFQAAKTLDPEEKYLVRFAHTAHQAKKFGRRVKLRDDWEPKE